MDSSHSLDDITRLTAQTDSFKEVVDRLQKGREQILLHGLPSTLAAVLAAHIRSVLDRPVLPAWDVEVYDRQSPDDEITGLRAEAASRLLRGEPTIIVAPAQALL